jgi:SAM-dependent methyltransferase
MMSMASAEGPVRGYFSRSRSLKELAALFGRRRLDDLAQRAHQAASGRVLEIGCGEGRVLLELSRMYRGLELHGINKEPWMAMHAQESLLETARFHSIMSPDELASTPLPTIHFCDAEKLPFESAHFDLVISQVSFHYIADKFLALREVWRTLKPDGTALLHVDTIPGVRPDFLAGETPRFVTYAPDGKIWSMRDVCAALAQSGYDIAFSRSERAGLVHMKKNTERPMGLLLTLDAHSSFDLGRLKRGEGDPTFWGFRSIYQLELVRAPTQSTNTPGAAVDLD